MKTASAPEAVADPVLPGALWAEIFFIAFLLIEGSDRAARENDW
jgi:hypothetical protein